MKKSNLSKKGGILIDIAESSSSSSCDHEQGHLKNDNRKVDELGYNINSGHGHGHDDDHVGSDEELPTYDKYIDLVIEENKRYKSASKAERRELRKPCTTENPYCD